MNDNAQFWDQRIIRNVIQSSEFQLKHLAEIAGISIDDVFRYGDLGGVDLRGQDLSGIDLARVDLSSSLYDMTTILDDQRSLRGGQDNLLAALDKAIIDARDLPDSKLLSLRFRNALLNSPRSLFFIGKQEDLLDAVREVPNTQFPEKAAVISGGYYKKSSLLIAKNNNQSVMEGLFEFTEKTYPRLLSEVRFARTQSTQLELPLDETVTLKPAVVSESVDINRLISVIKSYDRISNIWIVVDTISEKNNIREIQLEVSRIMRLGIKLNIIFICQNDDLLNSSWRRSTISDRDTIEFLSESFKSKGLQGFFRSISDDMINSIKFSKSAIAYINDKYSNWHQAQETIRLAARNAIIESRKIPINVGIKFMRSAAPE